MRSFAHWTPRYIVDRVDELLYRKTYPDRPWLTETANAILASYLRPADMGLEFGSGRSTLWFAQRVGHITSIEHDEGWYRKVVSLLSNSGHRNVDYRLIPRDAPEQRGDDSSYARVTEQFENGGFDFVLVDGAYRDACALKALRTIRPGGLLIIDNVNWYLPSTSRSPNSRTAQQGPSGTAWIQLQRAVADWRRIWTISGTTDTAFFFKPYV
jgi:predicted O-methyltransferase YrrM